MNTENHSVVRLCGSRHRLTGQLWHVPTNSPLADDVRRQLLQFAGYVGYRDELEEDVALRIDRIVMDKTADWSETDREVARAYYRSLVPRYVDAMIEVPMHRRFSHKVIDLGWDFIETFARLPQFPWIGLKAEKRVSNQ